MFKTKGTEHLCRAAFINVVRKSSGILQTDKNIWLFSERVTYKNSVFITVMN
jgi:hypothetical protein